MTMSLAEVRALTFDVFGTVVDWRGTVIREGEELGQRKSIDNDWESFADEWRFDGYREGMARVRRGELPWMKVDQLHRLKLDQLLSERGITGLTEEEIDHFNRVWHRLDPWPDSPKGLDRLRSKFIVATLSNGNVSLLVNMAKHGGLPWDCILSSELAGAFKPDPKAYLKAADLLDLEPKQVMMVAAHQSDLRAAREVGFHTAFVKRPKEFGLENPPDRTPDSTFDVVADDFLHLAVKLGC